MSQAAVSPDSQPAMFFVGVTTGQSAILRVFPRWAAILGLDAQLVGYDCPLGAPPRQYRSLVRHIRQDPLALGALVTAHKIDLLAAARAEFDYLDPYARQCGEISCISKRGGLLRGHAKDVGDGRSDAG